MGCFSNGSEGDSWEEWNCAKCLHDAAYRGWMNPEQVDPDLPGIEPPPQPGGCPLWASQIVHNGEPETRTILDELIPMDGLFCGKCKMFIQKDD